MMLGKHCKHLTSIDLSLEEITSELIDLLARNCPNLTTIDFGVCKTLSDKILTEIGKKFSKLKSITLIGAPITEGILSLKNLSKFHSELKNNTALDFIKNNPHLTTLSLKGCSDLNINPINEFFNHCKQLRHLDLTTLNIDDNTLNLIQENCQNLTEIILSGKGFTDKGLKMLSSCKKLTHIDFSGNFTDNSISFLAKAELNLTHIKLCMINNTNEMIIDVFKLKVQKLSLNFFSKSLLQIIGDTICPTLYHLDLSLSHLNHHSYQKIALLCPNLEQLILAETTQDTDLKTIALFCRNLTYLNLCDCNHLTDESLTHLEQARNLKLVDIGKRSRLTRDAINAFRQKHSQITVKF